MSKPKNVKISSVIKSDASYEVFSYFRSLIEMNCLEEHFQKEKIALIKKNIEDSISSQHLSSYVIIIGKDMAYYLQTKKKHLIMLKIEEIAIFIYQTKHIEVPRFITMEPRDTRNLSPERLEELKSLISVTVAHNIDLKKEEAVMNRIKDYISYYYLKHEEEEKNNPGQFESKFVTQLRTLVLVASHRHFWNIFLANKIECIIEQSPSEAFLQLELDFPCYRARKIKKKLLIFQKKGSNPKFLESLGYKIPELVSFLAMILIFFTLVTCREYNFHAPVNPENPQESQHEERSLRGMVCQNKNFVLSMAAMFLFSVFFGKFWKKFLEKKRKKAELMEKIKREKAEKKDL